VQSYQRQDILLTVQQERSARAIQPLADAPMTINILTMIHLAF